MNKANQLAQWVVDNRFAKSENEKVSDFEVYQTLVEGIQSFAKSVAEDALKRVIESITSNRDLIIPSVGLDGNPIIPDVDFTKFVVLEEETIKSILSTPINLDLAIEKGAEG